MKKIVLVFLFLSCFLLVGCSSFDFLKNQTQTDTENKQGETTTPKKEETKKNTIVSCSLKTEGSIDFITEMAYFFENDKIVKLGVKYTYDLSKYTAEQRNAFASSKMCETDAIKNTLGMVDCQEELVNTDYIVKGYSEKLLQTAVGTPSIVKSSYTSQGWTCSEQ